MIWLLACTKAAPVDSPVDSGCAIGSVPGACAPDFTLSDADGASWSLADHDPAIVSVTVMWVPAWQDVVRALDDLHAETNLATVDVLVEDVTAEDADAEDAVIWADSLGLSIPVLLADEAFRESWEDPAPGPYAVFVEGGVITWRGTQAADVEQLKERLEAR